MRSVRLFNFQISTVIRSQTMSLASSRVDRSPHILRVSVIHKLTTSFTSMFTPDLPSDFLSTPFGAALRPTIDAMFRRPAPGQAPLPPSQPGIASSILQNAVAQATAPTTPMANSAPTTVAAPVQIATNPASLNSILQRHKAVCVLFTAPATCPPCRTIAPVFDNLAHEKASPGVAFVKIDMDTGMANATAGQYSIRATPTFLFFVNNKKVCPSSSHR